MVNASISCKLFTNVVNSYGINSEKPFLINGLLASIDRKATPLLYQYMIYYKNSDKKVAFKFRNIKDLAIWIDNNLNKSILPLFKHFKNLTTLIVGVTSNINQHYVNSLFLFFSLTIQFLSMYYLFHSQNCP